MEQDHWLPPRQDELLTKFDKVQVLSTLDMTSSYWQIPIKGTDRKYTGFLFDNRTYVFNVLPFGLSTSVASFMRGLSKVLGPEVEQYTLVYVDDCCVFSENFEKHLKHLEIILTKFQEANLTIKLSKSVFVRAEVNFLGHVISEKGVKYIRHG